MSEEEIELCEICNTDKELCECCEVCENVEDECECIECNRCGEKDTYNYEGVCGSCEDEQTIRGLMYQ